MTIDELSEYGMQRMDDEEIENFLKIQNQGVLGLPTENAPYLLPMSYGFDGGSRLYFYYVVGAQSRKEDLSVQAETASFLVYNAEMFHWRSVLLTGTIQNVPEEKQANLTEAQIPTWRPELIKTASKTEEARFYEFQIEEHTGIRHDIQAPTFDQRSSRDDKNIVDGG
ncbi:pyridoxamine 5'-phosphate oxidase family protein [Natronococcus wangiae]|uniref:pyridoxamine 5'-phosphate oxidase family protein n=1 Tax=Natronococcus wangiae TaxID=3068275 RepID=UPI00273D19FA|nr:pyridoxamine 5'-phosphate oxidase family protein [Natronococcus sp. AD5]